jgi:hypothetical protein
LLAALFPKFLDIGRERLGNHLFIKPREFGEKFLEDELLGQGICCHTRESNVVELGSLARQHIVVTN